MRPNIMLAAMSALPPRRQHKRWAQGIRIGASRDGFSVESRSAYLVITANAFASAVIDRASATSNSSINL